MSFRRWSCKIQQTLAQKQAIFCHFILYECHWVLKCASALHYKHMHSYPGACTTCYMYKRHGMCAIAQCANVLWSRECVW